MKEQLISLKTAKLAKEVGFDDLVPDFYQNGELMHDYGRDLWSVNFSKNKIAVPKQCILQKWLRDTHNLHVVIHPEFYTTGINYCVQVLCYDPKQEDCTDSDKCTFMYGDNGEYPTYEDALEFGLELALNLIK